MSGRKVPHIWDSPKDQELMKLTREQLWDRLAKNRINRYPHIYRGYEEDAHIFVRNEYKNKSYMITACINLGA